MHALAYFLHEFDSDFIWNLYSKSVCSIKKSIVKILFITNNGLVNFVLHKSSYKKDMGLRSGDLGGQAMLGNLQWTTGVQH